MPYTRAESDKFMIAFTDEDAQAAFRKQEVNADWRVRTFLNGETWTLNDEGWWHMTVHPDDEIRCYTPVLKAGEHYEPIHNDDFAFYMHAIRVDDKAYWRSR